MPLLNIEKGQCCFSVTVRHFQQLHGPLTNFGKFRHSVGIYRLTFSLVRFMTHLQVNLTMEFVIYPKTIAIGT